MFRPLPSGERRKRVQLVRRNNAQDAVGQATGYTPYATVWAKIEEANASEVFKAQQYTSEVSHLVNIHWTSSITPKSMDRVQYGARTFDIKSIVNPEERNIEWHLLCLELEDGVAPGA
jgi:SPP1 family predicted phage head-tail adaptor